MVSEEFKRRIREDKDFIAIKRFEFSLDKLIERYSDGVPVRLIAQALGMTEEEVEKLYQVVLVKLREKIG